MAGALKGDVRQLSDLKRRLTALPRTMAVDVANRAAPKLTTLTHSAFDAGRSVYGDPRPAGAKGQALTLRNTGAVAGRMQFVALGTTVRCDLGSSYAKFLIGKYGILPNGFLPADWSAALRDLAATTKVDT